MEPFAKYRTAIRRILAGLFDGLLFMLPPLALAANGVFLKDKATQLSVVYSITPMLYSVFMHYKYGQTLGKMALGIKVVNVDDEARLSLRQAVLRDSPWLVMEIIGLAIALAVTETAENSWLETIRSVTENAFSLWVILEVASMLTNQKRRAIHDFLAGTVVIKLLK